MLEIISDRGKTEAGSSKPVLDVSITSLIYSGTPVLGAIDLAVKRSETVALTGPSGVGKTTFLRVIAGLETGFNGTCAVTGKLSVIFQEPTLLPWRTVRDNITITAQVSANGADIALDEVGLAGRGDDFPSQLSLGQQRRLALARAFATKPDLLLMDEPFVSLDAALVGDMMALFAKLRTAHDVTTILVTHAEAEARQLASRIVILGGSPARIVDDASTLTTLR